MKMRKSGGGEFENNCRSSSPNVFDVICIFALVFESFAFPPDLFFHSCFPIARKQSSLSKSDIHDKTV